MSQKKKKKITRPKIQVQKIRYYHPAYRLMVKVEPNGPRDIVYCLAHRRLYRKLDARACFVSPHSVPFQYPDIYMIGRVSVFIRASRKELALDIFRGWLVDCEETVTKFGDVLVVLCDYLIERGQR